MFKKRSRAAYEADQAAQRYEIYGALGPPPDPGTDLSKDNVPVWKQEVTDEQGRKRLHGAFTGGYSAGYFNTVGSKEGWTPASFVSSRAQRYKDSEEAKRQKPEDFMDDEDLAEQEGAEQLQQLTDFAGLQNPTPNGNTSTTGSAEPNDSRSEAKVRRKPRPKASFGVGVLNDTGSDDEDPYSLGPQISLSRKMGGNKSKKGKKGQTNTAADPEHNDSSLVTASEARRAGEDGDFDRRRAGDDPRSRSELHKSPPPPDPGPVIKKPPKSVFNFLTPAARARLVAATNNPSLPDAKSEAPPSAASPPPLASPSILTSSSTSTDLPALDPSLAQRALLREWTPYPNDTAKAARYQVFLTFRAELPDAALPTRATFQSQATFLAELAEFANAAQMFQPMTGFMASRFTTSSSSNANGPVTGGGGSGKGQGAFLSTRSSDPAEEAARSGMYGMLTRSVKGFEPTRLLCKRFNVKPPEGPPESRDIGSVVRGEEPRPDTRERAHVEGKSDSTAQAMQADVPPSEEKALVVSQPEKVSKDIEKAGQAAYRAIFGSDSEDE